MEGDRWTEGEEGGVWRVNSAVSGLNLFHVHVK